MSLPRNLEPPNMTMTPPRTEAAPASVSPAHSGASTRRRFSLAGAAASLLFAAVSAHGAVTLNVAGTAFPLITTGAGSHNIRVEATASASTSGATVIVEFRNYQGSTIVASGSVPLGTGTGLQVLQVPVNVPQLGFYSVTVRVSQSGSNIATATTSFAAVPVRSSAGPSDFGVCSHFSQSSANQSLQPAFLNLIYLAGFSRVRENCWWTTVEPSAGNYTFPAQYDAYVNNAANLGINILYILGTGNGAAYPGQFASSGLPDTTAGWNAYANYAKQCVLHFGSRVKQWEIWNEPAQDFTNYIPMLQAAYPAIKGANSAVTVISCGGGGAGGGPGGGYIVPIYNDGRAFNDMDGYSIHPYMTPNDPDLGYPAPGSALSGGRVNVPSTWSWDRGFINGHLKSNGTKLNYWVTEIGWTCVNTVTDAFQAQCLARTYLMSREQNIAQGVFIYDFMNDGTSSTDSESNFGLIRADWSPKPSYSAMAVLASTLGSLPYTSSIVENSSTKVLEYGSGNNFVIAAWTVAGDTQNVTLSLPSGSYALRDWQGHDSIITSVGGSVTIAINGAPQYVLPLKLETENLTVANYVSASGGTERVLPTDPGLSNSDGTILDSNNLGDYVTFLVPNIAAGSYDVRVGMKKFPSRGEFQLQIGRADTFSTTASNVGPVVDEYSATPVYSEVDLGTWSPGTTSDKWFRFNVAAKNSASTGSPYNCALCFDYITLIPH